MALDSIIMNNSVVVLIGVSMVIITAHLMLRGSREVSRTKGGSSGIMYLLFTMIVGTVLGVICIFTTEFGYSNPEIVMYAGPIIGGLTGVMTYEKVVKRKTQDQSNKSL